VTELYQPRRLAQPEHLHEQLRQSGEVPLAELRDAVVVRMLVGRERAECHITMRRAFDLPRRRQAHAVGVQQQLHHQSRVIRRPTPPVALLVGVDDGR
jgi:hypothetical protein